MGGGPQQPGGEARSGDKLDTKIMRGVGWSAISHGGSQILNLLSVLVLARLLEPKAFGLVALCWTFLTFLDFIQDSGLSAAVIYWRERVRAAAGSAVVVTPLVGLALTLVTVAAAPLLAYLFKTPALTDVLRVMALVVLVRGLGVVPAAIIKREFRFRALAQVELSGIAIQAGAAIGLAFAGFGVWSLVLGAIAGQSAQSALYWALTPWRPSPRDADRELLREMVRYGRYVGGARIVSLLNRTFDNMTVARVLGATSLGYYAIAYRVSSMPVSVIGNVVGKPMFAAYSSIQDDLPAVRRAWLQNLQRSALFAVPAAVALFVAAEPIIVALFGEEWRPAVVPLRILALFGLVRTLSATTGEVWMARGKPHYRLWWEVLVLGLTIPSLIVFTHFWGLRGTALAMLVVHGATGIPAMVITMRLISLRASEVARALGPLLPSAAVLAAAQGILLPTSLDLQPVAGLLLIAVAGVVAYVAATALFARGVVLTMWASLRGSPAR